MSKILNLYSRLLENKHRFLDEIFESDDYSAACPKLTIVDLGAYEGEFDFYCYNFAKKIYAVEPDPVPYANLVKYIEEFGLDKIKTFPIAIDKTSGKRYFNATHGGGSTFGIGDKSIEVKTLSLYDFFEENKIKHVDILKIDVESAEYEIFTAPDFYKAAWKIDTIIGEDHRGSLKDILEPYGFKYSTGPGHFIAKR